MEKEGRYERECCPINIFDCVYIHGFVDADENYKKNFMNLCTIDKIEYLIIQTPQSKKVKLKRSPERIFYAPVLGRAIISYTQNEDDFKYNSEEFAQSAAEDICSTLEKKYKYLNFIYHELEDAVYNHTPLNPKKWGEKEK